MLTEEAINEYKAMLEADFPDRSFSEQEIMDRAYSTLNIVREIYKPIPMEKIDLFRSLDPANTTGKMD